ncbi:MAG TPA: DNA-binding domain-containing protein [Steroidobacteraceae bacterium]|nr:DNA-binding domain-containing protein [Steroidobacteraceae bacterium]
MASLRELQGSFAAALRDPSAPCAVMPRDNLAIYRNNSSFAFRSALEAGFPVLRRRVGDEYFRQLAAQYRERHPSRSGDLHWVGRDFSAFLLEHLHGGDYGWLADLARLEWSREQASVSPVLVSVGADALRRFAPEQLEHLVFTLQPSLRLHASDFPIFTVWAANQVADAPPVDQSLAGECGLVRIRLDGPEVRPLAPDLFSYLSALAAGAPLGEAIAASGLDQAGLVNALGFVFNEALVCAVTVQGRRLGTSS